jgi:hypothetical protein
MSSGRWRCCSWHGYGIGEAPRARGTLGSWVGAFFLPNGQRSRGPPILTDRLRGATTLVLGGGGASGLGSGSGPGPGPGPGPWEDGERWSTGFPRPSKGPARGLLTKSKRLLAPLTGHRPPIAGDPGVVSPRAGRPGRSWGPSWYLETLSVPETPDDADSWAPGARRPLAGPRPGRSPAHGPTHAPSGARAAKLPHAPDRPDHPGARGSGTEIYTPRK